MRIKKKHRRTKRAVSVAAITTEQVKGSLNQKRLQKPWNQYKMVLQSDEQVAFPARVMSEETRRSSCKSFEEWLIEKEVEREQLFAQMTEEERKKAEEKEKLEQERRARCKSYEKWLVGKEVEEESIKEEEKRKEFEKQREEEKRKERKDVAEQKYEKWVQEKFKEELRKEEELRRLMKDKWKKREKSSSLRKESVGTVVKQPLVKTRSVPVL